MAYGSGYPGGYSDIIDTCAIPQGLFLDGLTGDYASTPDSDILSLQGIESVLELSGFQSTYADIPGNTADIAIGADLDLRWEGYIDNFITGGASDQQYLISNYNHNTAGFKIRLTQNSSTLSFQASISGSNASASGTHSLAPGTRIRVRVTRVFTTGLTTLFAGPASVDWLSLPSLPGSAVVFANQIIPNSATTMKIGSGEGASALSGRVSNVSMVVGGITVFNPDFSTSPWVIGDVSSQARLDAAGKTWTLRGNAGIVALAERRSLRLSGASLAYTSTPDSSAVSLQGTAQGLAFNGDSAGNITAPDTVGLSITGDFDVQFRLQPDVWGLPNATNLGGKYGAAGQRSWRIQLNGSGRPQLDVSSDGTAVTTITANATPSFTAGQAGWFRATWRASDGRVQFFTAPDAVTPSWTQLGTDQTAAIGSIFDSTQAVTLIGNGNLSPTTLRLLAFRYFAGLIETDTRANLNLTASPWSIGEQSGVSHSDGINTWTIGGNAEIVATAERRSLRVNGTSAYSSTPNAAPLGIVGDLDVRVLVALDDWTPATVQDLNAKFNATGNQRSWDFKVTTAGNLEFSWSADGAAVSTATSTVITGVPDGTLKWVRATIDVDNGATGRDIKFYTSDTGVTWTQLGTTVTQAGVTSIFNSTATLDVGGNASLNRFITGNILKLDLRNNILDNGTGIVADPNFTARPWDVGESSGVTGADAAGNTWTLNAAGSVIQRAFSSDIDLRAYFAPDSWTGNAGQGTGILAKWTDASTQFSFIFRLNAAAKTLNLLWSSNASIITFPNVTSTASVPFADGVAGWVRVTMDVDNGSNQRVAIFYTSTDGQNWTQLGATVTQSGATMFLDSTTPLTIGIGNLAQPGLMAGNVFYAEMRNGIDGVVVAAPDFRKRPWVVGDTSTANHADKTGDVWTLNASGSIIQRAYASDLEVKIRLSMTDWTPATNNTFVSKYDTNSQRSWRLFMDTVGRISWAYSENGVVPSTVSFASTPAISDGTTKWVKVTHDLGGGAGNVKLYLSDDNFNWTLIQSSTAVDIFGFYDSPAPLAVGAFLISGVTAERLDGIVYYVDARNGIDGTQIIAFNPAAPPWEVGDTSPTARADQFGNVFTLFGTAAIIGPTGNCDFVLNMCGGGYAGAAYNTFTYAGAVPCSGQDYPAVSIESNVEDFCVLSVDCS